MDPEIADPSGEVRGEEGQEEAVWVPSTSAGLPPPAMVLAAAQSTEIDDHGDQQNDQSHSR